MKRVLFPLVVLSNLCYGAEAAGLDSLLSEYRDANELSHETKTLKDGHVIVYSRADLDKMQAYTLNDVFKSMRFVTTMSTKFGMDTLVKSPFSEKATSPVKIFINSYEVTSLSDGTGLTQMSRMGINHIDHIEIYQASNAVISTGEPRATIVKLYTKEPSRENITALQASLDSLGGGRTQLIEAKSFSDYTYLASLDLSSYNPKEYNLPDGSELSRDGKRAQLYLNLAKKDDFKVELGASKEKDELFSGFGNSVDDGEFYTKNFRLQYTKYFDNDIRLILNTNTENIQIANSDSTGIILQDGTRSNLLEVDTSCYTHNAILEKSLHYGDNNLLFGTQLKLRSFDLDEIKSNGLDKKQDLVIGPKNLNAYMFYAEDAYAVNDDNTITFGAKLDIYDNHKNSSTETIFRIGYLSRLNETTHLRAFIQKGYYYPLLSDTTFSALYFTNPDLKSIKNDILKVELEKKIDNLTLTAGGGFARSKDGVGFNVATKTMITNPDTNKFQHFFVNAAYRFDADNKLLAEYFRSYKEDSECSPNNGALLQLYNTIGRFDIYNELIYRASYVGIYAQKINTGFDYTSGVIYHYSKQLDLKLKGENLLDRATQIGINGLKVAPYDRRAILTLEYMF